MLKVYMADGAGGGFVGRYLNPGQNRFEETLNSEIYVDKVILVPLSRTFLRQFYSAVGCLYDSLTRR